MQITKTIFLFLIGSLALFTACNQSVKTNSPEAVGLSADSLELAEMKMQEYIDKGKLSGISTIVIKDGIMAQRANFGFADIENKKAIEDNTISRIFSMTKPVTAAALMTLYDEGKFQLDDKISNYIPEFKNTKVYTQSGDSFTLEAQKEEITIRHLLTHTSGISYGWDWDSYVDSLYRVNNVSGWDATIGEKVKLLAQMPLRFQPGTKWKYGLSIDVAGYLIEVLSGMPLDEFFKTRIFEPLKMDDTGFYVPEEKHDRLALLYRINKEGKLKAAAGDFAEAFKKPGVMFAGGAGLVSTMEDYATFCEMLLNGGELNGARILEEETVKLIMTDQLPKNAKYTDDSGYGLAGAVLKYRLPNPKSSDHPHLVPLADARKALKLLRQKAKQYGIDKNKVGVVGFSAGSHLSTALSLWKSDDKDENPDFSGLIYGVTNLSEENKTWLEESLYHRKMTKEELAKNTLLNLVSENTPPAFLVHACNDDVCMLVESTMYAEKLIEKNVLVEMHLFPKGGHGFGLGRKSDGTDQWLPLFANWIKRNF